MNLLCILALTATLPTGFPEYDTRTVEGWQVHIERGFLEESPEQVEATLRLLKTQLYLITRNVPHGAVAKLHEVPIWVEKERLPKACMAYHPNINWLREHGVNPKKAKSIEIINAKNFLSWCRAQPNMVLHELAHAYHDRFLGGFGNKEIAEVYDAAMKEGIYEKVLHIGGKEQKAYATTNPMEYFAENSEAFFGTNDFYPFVKPELEKHDPRGAQLLKRMWWKFEEEEGR
jgi:hypothetical protein